MRAPLSWLRDLGVIPATETARGVAAQLVRLGLEVERVHTPELTGPLVVGVIAECAEEKHSNGKTIRWCTVDVGEASPRGIVCGAGNFSTGDQVVVALPGALLPGGFAIAARRSYGHTSDGMICSARELGLGDDHTGILVLPLAPAGPALAPGAPVAPLLGLDDDVLELDVLPDRGYCLSMRGVGRELATAYGLAYDDPADEPPVPTDDAGHPVLLADPGGCDRFVALNLAGVDPTASSPLWLARRIRAAGMRPVSLVVDVTNYVMLALGQPLHAYDAALIQGPIEVRRARPGESLRTLDGALRTLHEEDLLITDDSGPIGIAGVMGGASTEISAATTGVVIEAAHFDPASIARAARRHRLGSEASRRFERGADPALPPRAAALAARLLVELGGARTTGCTDLDRTAPSSTISLDPALPARLGGLPLEPARVLAHLRAVGCSVDPSTIPLAVRPPSWRPDLTDPADLVEEVLRLEGYDAIPSVLPATRPGRGLTEDQRLHRRIGRALAAAGYVEVLCSPFLAPDVWDGLGADPDDPRRSTLRLANPLSEAEPALRTSLLPGLLAALRRNVGRGLPDVAVFETGLVYHPCPSAEPPPAVGVERRPSDAEVAALDSALPAQPRHLAVALCGNRDPGGWWGPGRPAAWSDALEAARRVAREFGVDVEVRAASLAPWHPGRCAALLVAGEVFGHAGEVHPRVVQTLGLPAGTCVAELSLEALARHRGGLARAPEISPFPAATLDVALVTDLTVAAGVVEAALRDGAGALLEDIQLFDVYTGAQVGPGRRSLAFALRLRAPDRTLTAEEAVAARDAAVAEAARRTGALLRGS